MKKYIRVNDKKIKEVSDFILEGFIEIETDLDSFEIATKYEFVNNELVQKTIVDKSAYRKEIDEIRQWFRINDWIPNKIIAGEWETTDPRWTTYLEERTVKRARRDELLELLR